jgi:hypothetical protein
MTVPNLGERSWSATDTAVMVQAIYADGRTWTSHTETPIQHLVCVVVSLERDCLVYRGCDKHGKPIREWIRGPRGFAEVHPWQTIGSPCEV